MAQPNLLLKRIKFDPGLEGVSLAEVPWPAGTAPAPLPSQANHDGSIPAADVLIITYTAAEGRALADVLTPGVQSTDWVHYTKNWDQFEPLLTGRSPAKESKRLGSWHLVQIGDKKVVCFKSELHPATDGPKLPLATLCDQLVNQVNPMCVITTGTAGAVGEGTQLGDVIVASSVTWDCERKFKNQDWAHTSYPTTPKVLDVPDFLLTPNFEKLPSELVTENRGPKVWADQSGTISTDFFAMGNTTDSYGLVKANPDCRAVEMDDAAIGLALSKRSNPPAWLSIRNASDPVMSGDAPLTEQSKQASKIYEKWGYTSTVGSAIVCWAAVRSL